MTPVTTEPPALPGEKWRGRGPIPIVLCAVAVDPNGYAQAYEWVGTKENPEPKWRAPIVNWGDQIIAAWAQHMAKVAAAERASRKAEEEVWLFAMGGADESRMAALRDARKVEHDKLRALGVEP